MLRLALSPTPSTIRKQINKIIISLKIKGGYTLSKLLYTQSSWRYYNTLQYRTQQDSACSYIKRLRAMPVLKPPGLHTLVPIREKHPGDGGGEV